MNQEASPPVDPPGGDDPQARGLRDQVGKIVAGVFVLLVTAATVGAALWSRQSQDLAPPDPNTRRISIPADAPRFDTGFEDGLSAWDFGGVPWSVQGAGADAVLRAGATREVYPVALWATVDFGDADVSVRFRLTDTTSEAAAGIVFRARDHRSYYAVRASGIEDNVRLYTMEEGERVAIAGAEVSRLQAGRWYTMRVVAVGKQIQVYLDDQLVIDQADEKYSQGKVGVWVIEDSTAEFDDFSVSGAAASAEATPSVRAALPLHSGQ